MTGRLLRTNGDIEFVEQKLARLEQVSAALMTWEYAEGLRKDNNAVTYNMTVTCTVHCVRVYMYVYVIFSRSTIIIMA